MAATHNVERPWRAGTITRVPVAAATRIFAGAIVEADAAGRLVRATKGAGKHYLGYALEEGDNRNGAAGALTIDVRISGVVHVAATAGHIPLVGALAYVEDDTTVHSGMSGRSALGRVVGSDTDGVWVGIGRGSQ